MRIVFKQVKLENFMSYKEATLQLDRHGYILVNGINNNPVDNAQSNGTGKSTLFSAISWALTGLTVGGGKEVANIHTDGTTSVELDFYVDSVHYLVLRTKNPSNLKVYVDGENKSGKGIRDTEKLLAEYLPDITHSLINSVIILGQGLPQKFTNHSPSGRKAVLEKLSNSDFMIADLKTRVNNRIETLKTEIRDCENNLTDLTARKEMTEKQIEDINNRLSSEFNELSLSELQNEKSTVDNNIIQTTTEYESISDKLESISKQLTTLNEAIAEKTATYVDTKATLELIDDTAITESILELSAKSRTLQNEISKLDSVKDVCPTCGQKLPDVHKIDTTDMKSELDTVRAELSDLNTKKLEIQMSNAKLISDFDFEFNNSIKDLRTEVSTLETQKRDITTIYTKLANTLKGYESYVINIQAKIESFEHIKNQLQNSISALSAQLLEFSDKILYYNTNKDNLVSKLDINNKMSTILKRDFRGYLLSNVIEYISTQAKSYAKELFNSDKLDFVLEGNNISIIYDGKDYEVLSGGEKQKVDVIIQLSIRDMLCTFLNFSSNILVLDEITDNLDSVGSQKMFNLISTRLNDVEAVYIVSHHTDFEIPVDSEITVMKGSDKISRIV